MSESAPDFYDGFVAGLVAADKGFGLLQADCRWVCDLCGWESEKDAYWHTLVNHYENDHTAIEASA